MSTKKRKWKPRKTCKQLGQCPNCGSTDLEYTDSDGSELDGYEWKNRTCNDCGAEIMQTYKFTEMEVISLPDSEEEDI